MSGVTRARKGVALILSLAMKQCVLEGEEVFSRLMWVNVKFGREL